MRSSLLCIRLILLVAANFAVARLCAQGVAQEVLEEPIPEAGDPDTAAEPANEILVRGNRIKYSEVISQIQAISNPTNGQLARYQEPVCPHVAGLSTNHSTKMQELISDLARHANIKVADPNCAPNLTVIIVPSGRDFIESLKKKRPELFAQMSAFQFRKLIEGDGPVWLWQSVEPKRSDGAKVEYVGLLEGTPGSPPRQMAKGAYVVPGATLSRITLPTRQDVTGTFVIINESAVIGRSLRQISDFAGVAALTGAKIEGLEKLNSPTILRLFDCFDEEICHPHATEFDMALLKARYEGSASFAADKEFKLVASSILREVSGY